MRAAQLNDIGDVAAPRTESATEGQMVGPVDDDEIFVAGRAVLVRLLLPLDALPSGTLIARSSDGHHRNLERVPTLVCQPLLSSSLA